MTLACRAVAFTSRPPTAHIRQSWSQCSWVLARTFESVNSTDLKGTHWVLKISSHFHFERAHNLHSLHAFIYIWGRYFRKSKCRRRWKAYFCHLSANERHLAFTFNRPRAYECVQNNFLKMHNEWENVSFISYQCGTHSIAIGMEYYSLHFLYNNSCKSAGAPIHGRYCTHTLTNDTAYIFCVGFKNSRYNWV